MKIKEWIFPEESEDYSIWEKAYIKKRKIKKKIKKRLKTQDSDSLSLKAPSSISF